MTDSAYHKNAVKPFVILSSQRSGSTFVRIWLNHHSEIHSYGEVFLRHYESADGFKAYCARDFASRWLFRIGHSRLVRGLRLGIFPKSLVGAYLNELLYGENYPAPWTDVGNKVNDTQARKKKSVIGLKLMYNTIRQYPALEKWIFEQNPNVIHLTRENLLRKYVSMVRLNITRVAHIKAESSMKKKVNIDVKNFIEFADSHTATVAMYRDRLLQVSPYLELSYEEFFADTGAAKDNILDFLELGNQEMPFPEMKKIGSNDLSDDIENWDEVCNALVDTNYEKFLDARELPH
ncbi:MAG: sulfotransferase [Gammaproteobacteria bacterium]|nr:sulfotransferase [Gammaproteobacteria bacterium]